MKNVFFMGALCVGICTQAQESVKDSIEVISLDEVLVSAVRAKETLPVTFSNLSKKEIQRQNFGQQIPLLIGQLPNVVSFSEDGSGLGASYFSVRGSDLYRTNVTINGIAYNDSESQGTFWYNLSDFASSAESIQLQRGVGTSTNGAGAFGASLNILTDVVSENSYAELGNFYGSYNTHKHSVKLSTGKLNDRFEILGRFSKINSDGYRERASSDLKSYFLQGTYSYQTTLIKALVFGGKEKTYLTYKGIDEATLHSNRRYNPAGKYIDNNGQTQFYENETDNYQQDHAQLHWVEKWTPKWTTNIAFHYTKGRGYWEQYDNWGDYLIVQYGLDNDFYGSTFSTNYKSENIDIIFGGTFNKYEGLHYDKLLWSEKDIKPYGTILDEDTGYKKEGSSFAKITWKIAPKWNIFGDIQYRYVSYQAEKYNADEDFNFINPKIGINYLLTEQNQLYFSFAQATKEPNRSDYKNSYKEKLNRKPKAEKLNDFELGWRYQNPSMMFNLNVYYMIYKNQLVPTGKLNDKGYPIRNNSGDSYRLGIEWDATFLLSDRWNWKPNIALSKNRNKNYHQADMNQNPKNWGNTPIAFSPEWVIGNTLTFLPIKNLQISLLSKLVGEQYMSNTGEDASKLKSYFVNNLNLSYEIQPKKLCKSVVFSALATNIFNKKYVASGTYENGQAFYFPQAEANYLIGLTLMF